MPSPRHTTTAMQCPSQQRERFVRARASSPVGSPPAVAWLLRARPEAVLAGLLPLPWMHFFVIQEVGAESR